MCRIINVFGRNIRSTNTYESKCIESNHWDVPKPYNKSKESKASAKIPFLVYHMRSDLLSYYMDNSYHLLLLLISLACKCIKYINPRRRVSSIFLCRIFSTNYCINLEPRRKTKTPRPNDHVRNFGRGTLPRHNYVLNVYLLNIQERGRTF